MKRNSIADNVGLSRAARADHRDGSPWHEFKVDPGDRGGRRRMRVRPASARALQRNRPNVRTVQPSNVGGLGHRDGRLHQLEDALATLSGAAVRERRGRKDLHGLESRKRNQDDDRKHHAAHRAITYRRRAKGERAPDRCACADDGKARPDTGGQRRRPRDPCQTGIECRQLGQVLRSRTVGDEVGPRVQQRDDTR